MALYTTKRLIGTVPRLVGRLPSVYAQELQEFLEKLLAKVMGGVPAGFNSTTPSTVEAGVAAAAGTESAGWAAADHIHDASTGAAVSLTPASTNQEGSSSSLSRSDHTHDTSALVIHNDLTGLQGGGAAERYHLTAAQHAIAIDPLFQRGGVFLSPAAAAAIVIWRAPYACTVLNVRGRRNGGTGATINAQKNGASTHLSSDLSLTSDVTWMDGGAVQNADYAAGDYLELLLQSVSGGPTQVAIQVDFRRTG